MTLGYENQRKYRDRRRAKAREYLGGVCTVCGIQDDLEFDHIDPASKTEEITSAIVAGWSWERLRVELDKCQLLCRPHHIEKSKDEGSYGGEPWNKWSEIQHGTMWAYVKFRCRCTECRARNTQYKRERRQASRVRKAEHILGKDEGRAHLPVEALDG